MTKAVDVTREAVAYLTGVAEADAQIDVVCVLSAQFTNARQRAERLRAGSGRLQHEPAQDSRQVASGKKRPGAPQVD